eukprot:COSAG01_NODE_31462_length_597_cov_0.919679_1_plen_48_part_10
MRWSTKLVHPCIHILCGPHFVRGYVLVNTSYQYCCPYDLEESRIQPLH